ncbi:MAG TPA: trehalase family glycosidase [Chloroflexota bacterium]|nr:trehalase family glycosidase [Chloroflexota bacterium]
MEMMFPSDDYTPFGYLANPYHRARSWSDTEGGLVRSTDDALGFGWVEPTARQVESEAAIVLVLRWAGRVYQLREDFARLGYRSRHHSSVLFSYDWEMDRLVARLSVALAERDALVAELSVENRGALSETVEVFLLGRVGGRDARWTGRRIPTGWDFRDARSGREIGFAVTGADVAPVGLDQVVAVAPAMLSDGRLAAGFSANLALRPGERGLLGAGLARGPAAIQAAATAAGQAGAVCAEKRAIDDAFYARAAQPVGDWPAEWKRGWVYDLETTRACIFPSGGSFRGAWPSWMISWPRVVLAEGSLDATRFSYAAPDAALALARTLLVDAPAPNVPCIFQGGEPNMVAKDGSVCGTSPAWCLPFYNFWLLYCRTLDRAWLAEVFPRLEAYLAFWLSERTDEDGWIVYKCTWEAGEDCTPRLDPSGSGDDVVSRYVRPVELQATFSQSAAIVSRFARELGDSARAERWAAVAEDYARRTQTLWDPTTGRYRDWDKRTGSFLAAPGDPVYWKTDPVRFSALSLTPIVAGIATPAQLERLRAEIAFYDAPPWCLWPSWSYVVAEAATTAGWYDVAGPFASRIVGRVYHQNDRRSIAHAARPTPGTAPEFWPLDLADFNGSDGYGWGATTTSLWVRQIFGFLDGTNPSEFSFTLAPSLPADLLVAGRRFGFDRLPYRGRRFDISYEVNADGIEAVIRPDRPCSLTAFDARGQPMRVRRESGRNEARFQIRTNEGHRIILSV